MVPGVAALFALLTVGIALAGLAASGTVVVQGFTRTAVSLMTLALYLLPLVGAILGATAFGDDGAAALLLAQPVDRRQAILGRAAGLALALALVATAGFGAAGLLVWFGAGADGMGGYVLVAVSVTLVAMVWLGLGILAGVLTRRRGAAIGWALAIWIGGAVVYDLLAIGTLQLVGDGQPGAWLLALLMLNPIDAVRALLLLALGADVLLGSTGAALEHLFGAHGGAALVAASLAAWLTLPIATATWTYRRRDF